MTTTAPARTEEVKKLAAAIHITGKLSIIERRLVNILLLNAYDDLTLKNIHAMNVDLLCASLGWDVQSNNVQHLKKALRKIITTAIEFDSLDNAGAPRQGGSWKEAGEYNGSGLLAWAQIKGGVCSYQYSDWLATNLKDPEIYAIIQIGVQRKFSSVYALALYENCLRFARTGSTGYIPVQKWRGLLGAQAAMYDEFRHFNNHVLKKAMDEINAPEAGSNMRINAEFQRTGRKVEAIRFVITQPAQMTIQDAIDENIDAIRETRAYQLLRAEGIGDKWAVPWVRDEEQRVIDAVEHVQHKQASGTTVTNRAGLIRSIFESGSVIDVSFREKAKLTRNTEREPDDKPKKPDARDELTPEEIEVLRREFIANTPGAKAGEPGRVKAPHSFAFREYVADNKTETIAKRGY
jgi:hypothetical protein